MNRSEITHSETTLHPYLNVSSLDSLSPDSLSQLPHLFFQGWNKEGLCQTLKEAENKLAKLDPTQAYAAIDEDGVPYALIHTLLAFAPNLPQLCRHFPSYQSVLDASAQQHIVTNPSFRICFSLVSSQSHRVIDPLSHKDISLSQFLIHSLPHEPTIFRLAYSRTPAVGMHEHYGAITAAILDQSRPEDKATNGSNTLMLYPRNEPEAKVFTVIKQNRTPSSPLYSLKNAHIFADLDFLFAS